MHCIVHIAGIVQAQFVGDAHTILPFLISQASLLDRAKPKHLDHSAM